MEKYKWIYIDDNWPVKNRRVLLETNQGLCVGHTNSTEDVIFDAYLIRNGCEQPLAIIRWKYITNTQHIFLMDNLESFEKYNKQ